MYILPRDGFFKQVYCVQSVFLCKILISFENNNGFILNKQQS